eukprot:TRINITY_DN45397_c0_g1_i1.p1 TRINITY_DN45397_c0_g1~~TRINITY_DN45397_c0_g1_i1.p1  ORF type:complete len:304 (+),score=43.81 TRINITY_DN45397_c0_g1_i1:66-914(+)
MATVLCAVLCRPWLGKNILGISKRHLASFATLSRSPKCKSTKSALVIMPPVRCWNSIQEVRRQHDKGFYRWMPHINVLYPFYADVGETFEEAAAKAERALQNIAPFDVYLESLQAFQHGRRSSTVWLDPASDDDVGDYLQEVHAALLAAFPECTDLSSDQARGITRFVPHLSLGGWAGLDDANDAMTSLSAKWKAVEFFADSVYLISRASYDEAFQVRWEIPLNGGAKPGRRERNLRYAAMPTETGPILDEWKGAKDRPGLLQFQSLNLDGRSWGLFEQQKS